MIRYTLRNLLARKVRLVMSTLAVVLGVAFLAGVLVFGHGLRTTFDGIIKGSTPDAVVRAQGVESFSAGDNGIGTATLTPADVTRLAGLPQVASAAGSVDGYGLSLLDHAGHLVGGRGAPTLAFNYTASRDITGQPILQLRSGAWPTAPGQVVLDTQSAQRGGYAVGDTVTVIAPFGTPLRHLTLVGTADFNGGGTAGATLVVFDTRGAQQLFLHGRDAFTSVNLDAAPGVGQTELAAAAQRVLPHGFEAVTGDQVVAESQNAVNRFLGVISTFLLVFALIAVFVGGFIIVNTFSILIAQRTRELALLRALGASRRQVTRSVLLEAFVMALIASTLGILGGWALARGLAALFRAIGLDIAGDALRLTASSIVLSYAVGLGVTLLAAYLPARRAARVAPVAAMREDPSARPSSLRRRAVAGAGVLLLGAAVAALGVVGAPGSNAAWVGVGAFLWILTVAAISPVVGRPVLLACRSVFTRLFGTTGRLAGENALRDPRRTGATASALMIGLALVSTIGVLAASLNASVDDVVNEEFTSDFLVQSVGFTPFPASIGTRMRDVPGVGVVSQQQTVRGRLTVPNGHGGTRLDDVLVSGNDPGFDSIYRLTVVAGRQRISGDEALVTQAEASAHGWKVGSTVTVGFPAGRQLRLRIAGIIEQTVVTGAISVPLATLAGAGVERQDTAVSIDVAPGADPTTVHAALDKVVAPLPVVNVQDKGEFADSIRGQVNQLLYIIYGLLALAIVIAVIGIVNTLGLSVLERTRELGLLRAIGLSRSRLRRMVTLESVAIAVLGAVLGMALGLIFGTLLRQTLASDLTSLGLPVGQLVGFLVLAIVVGVLAAVVPAIRAARLNVLEAIAAE